MTTYIAPGNIGDILLVEVKPGWTKQRVTYAAGHLILAGTVIASIGDKYVPLDVAASDGSEKAVGIAGETVDATKADAKGVAILRGAVVDTASLLWPVGITDPQKAIAISQLDARGIVAASTLTI
jgi:hypothetical protein